MICLTLFWNFLMIGTLSFGGGYGMISLVREVVLGHGWLTESEFLSFIAVSESTPGPLAVNMATFIGSSQAGLPGALAATLGVVLPSFVIILLVAAVLRSVLRYAGVQAVLDGVRPCVVAMILATAVTMGLSTLGGYTAGPAGGFAPDGRAIAVFVLLGLVHCGYKKIRQKDLELSMQGNNTIDTRLAMFRHQREVLQAQMDELQHTLRMVEYKCWYYETAQAAGTVEVLRDMPEDKVPEQFRAIRQELKQQPEG